eukprot:m.225218 g.225218  ORF g.225218 m.225218 type:complete len:182 (-) comp15955_c0_seq5:1728-2273(-)
MSEKEEVVEVVRATASDWETVADLHARSWQVAYKGIMSDEYLDGPVFDERRGVWETRFKNSDMFPTWICQVNGYAAGFACVKKAPGGVEEKLGVFIDNLHVLADFQRRGIATRLMQACWAWSKENYPEKKLHLTVYEDNKKACAFYSAIGGHSCDPHMYTAEDGSQNMCLRYVWESKPGAA